MEATHGNDPCTPVEDVSRRAMAAGYLALPRQLALGDQHRLAKQLDGAYAAVVQTLCQAGPYYFGRIDSNRLLACALHARLSNQPLSAVDLECPAVNAYLAFAQLASYY